MEEQVSMFLKREDRPDNAAKMRERQISEGSVTEATS